MNSFAVIMVCSLSTMAFGFPMFKDLDHKYKICIEKEEDLRVLADKLCAEPTAIVRTVKTSENHLITDCCLGKCSRKIIKEHFCPEKKTDTETNYQPRSKRLVDETDLLPSTTSTSTITMTSTDPEPSTSTEPSTAEPFTTAEPFPTTTTINVPTCYPFSVKTQILDFLLRSLPIPIFPLVHTEVVCDVGINVRIGIKPQE